LTLNPDGSFTYTPEPDFEGTDEFSYRPAHKYGAGEVTYVSILVTNEDPTAGGDSWTGHAGETASGTVDFSDPDPHDTQLTVTVTAQGSSGIGSVSANGAWTYTPNNTSFVGTDSFEYTVTDRHGATTTATITVTFTGSGGSGGRIGSYAWDDVDGDGVQDANEGGLEGVTVQLLDSSGNVLSTTITGSGGFYYFSGLGAGTYEPVFLPPARYGDERRTGTFQLAFNQSVTSFTPGFHNSSGGSGGLNPGESGGSGNSGGSGG